MIQEDYVSYEVARLLREKEFDGEIHTTFDEEGYTQPSITHQMAMKWLRDVHDITIIIEPLAYNYVDSKTTNYVFCIWNRGNYEEPYSGKNSYRGMNYATYEEAVEAAIKYSLENLI